MINIEQVSQVTIGKNAVRFTAVRLSVGIGQYIAMITVVRPYYFKKNFFVRSTKFQSCIFSNHSSFIRPSIKSDFTWIKFCSYENGRIFITSDSKFSNFPRKIINNESGVWISNASKSYEYRIQKYHYKSTLITRNIHVARVHIAHLSSSLQTMLLNRFHYYGTQITRERGSTGPKTASCNH